MFISSRLVRFASIALLVVSLAPAASAQRRARTVSPEVAADGTVTFRLNGGEASTVLLNAGFAGGRPAMTKGDDGVFSITVGPLKPGMYDYSYLVDGVQVTDPHNPQVKIWQGGNASAFEVLGDEPAYFDRQAVPHGDIHIHRYDSQSLGQPRRMHVYTPPGYDANPSKRYPVFYLLHGSGDDDSTWTWNTGGRADLILDNLIAAGKAEPMIVVMTDGHPVSWGTRGGDNTALFEKDIVNDVIPFIDGRYRTKADQRFRAIAGLSMGGGQSLSVGLGNLELFDYIGAYSSAVPRIEGNETLQAVLNNAEQTNKSLKLLWIACGVDDSLLPRNEELVAALKEKGINHIYRQTAGGHSWNNWRDYLHEMTPLLFQEK